MTTEIKTANASFNITKKEARKIITDLERTINHNTVLPILEDVLISVEKTGVYFSTTDLENYFTIEAKLESYSGETIFCVNLNYLKWFFNKSTDEVLSLQYEAATKRLIMKSGKFTVKVMTEEAGNYPKAPNLGTELIYESKFESNTIVPIFRSALPFVSYDDLRPALTGVNFMSHNKKITIVATDAHRLFFKSLDHYDGTINKILPRKFVSVLCECFTKDFELSVYNNFVCADSGKKRIVSRLIDAKYPNWTAVLPSCHIEFCFNRKEVYDLVNITTAFSNYVTNQVKFELTRDEIKMTSGDLDLDSEADCSFKLLYSNGIKEKEKITFALNGEFLLTALRINQKEETVFVEHTGLSTRSMIFDKSILLMPPMVNDVNM